MKSTIIRLENSYQHYDWGTDSDITKILGIRAPAGNLPLAELWVGAHPNLPSFAVEYNLPLDQLIEQNPQAILGEHCQLMANKLPYLFKILSAKQALSIQVHPSKAQAEIGFKLEQQAGIKTTDKNCNYKDDNHKPELMYALTHFSAMAGFRPVQQMAQALAKLDVELFTPWCIKLLAATEQSESTQQQIVEEFYACLLYLEQGPLELACAQAVARAKQLAETDVELYWVAELYRIYGVDSGIFFPLILNLIVLQPGQAIFLGAGCPHAYLQGTGIEVMANSDNVLRGGLTQKFMDRQELIKVTRYDSAANNIQVQQLSRDEGEHTFDVPVPDFQLQLLNLVDDEFVCGQSGSAELYFVVKGSVLIDGQNFTNGQAFLLPASAKGLSLSGNATVARVYTQLHKS